MRVKVQAKPDLSPTFHRDGTREVSYYNTKTKQWERLRADEIDPAQVASADDSTRLRIRAWADSVGGGQAASYRGQLRGRYQLRERKNVSESLEWAELLDAAHDLKVVSNAFFQAAHNLAEQKQSPKTERRETETMN